MNKKTMFSSKTGSWETPKELFDALDRRYGPFSLDPAATKETALCDIFLTEEDNGLDQAWPGRVFLNPPYGREIDKWIKKAHDEVETGAAKIVVCLLPARTDTRWWHAYVMHAFKVWLIKGRIKFSGHKASAPFPSAIAVFKKAENRGTVINGVSLAEILKWGRRRLVELA
jgi:site-specific DNA-methyltransferase (adenine-specific)